MSQQQLVLLQHTLRLLRHASVRCERSKISSEQQSGMHTSDAENRHACDRPAVLQRCLLLRQARDRYHVQVQFHGFGAEG